MPSDAVFEDMDQNGNGQLECEELAHFMGKVCSRVGVEPPNPKQVRITPVCDYSPVAPPPHNQAGRPFPPSFREAKASTLTFRSPPTCLQIEHVFRHLDLNSDDSVARDELEAFLRHLFSEHLRQFEAQAAARKRQQKLKSDEVAAAAKPKSQGSAILAMLKSKGFMNKPR
jgi:hypothetical protein